MTWRDKIQVASIAGVPFEEEALDETIGRNVVSHEYVQSEDVYGDDLGRTTDTFNVDGYVWGPDYLDKLAALKKVVRTAGPHEYANRYGERSSVHIKRLAIRRTRKEGGYAGLRFELAESGLNANPATGIDSAAAVDARADEALPVLLDDFEDRFDVAGPGWLGDDAMAMIGEAGTMMGKVSGGLASAGRPLALAQRQLAGLQSGALSLLGAPRLLGGQLQGMMSQLLGLAPKGSARYQAAGQMANYGSSWSPVTPTTANRVQQADNRAALAELVRRTALVEQARASASMTWPTHDEAAAARDGLAARLDGESLIGSDRVVPPLRRLRGAMHRDITERSADLSRLADYTPNTTLPDLVIAYTLYGDAGRADEIVRRNPHVRRPLMIPGGLALKVVADG